MRTAALVIFLCACGGPDEGAVAAYNRALAAMRAGEPRVAATEAEHAAALDDGRVHELAIFLKGNAVYAQCLTAELAAGTDAAEPFAFDVAITYGESALDLWTRAAMLRDDWPAARRNAERALRKLRDLRRKKAEAEDKQRKRNDPKPKPQPPKPPPINPDPGKKVDEDPTTKVRTAELSPDEVIRLMDRLAEKEKEKLEVRRSERKKRAGSTERDW